MKIYLLDHSNTELLGHTSRLEFELRTFGIQIIDTTREADLILVVLDYEWPLAESLIVAHSKLYKPLWVYVPRGTIVSTTISISINEHNSLYGAKSVQRVYTYDATSDIVSWVLRLQFDLRIQQRHLLKIVDSRVKTMIAH